jgi:hypothetical protein
LISMKRIKLLWLALVAVFALSGLAVSAVQAQGPYGKVTGKTLKVGESRTVLTKIGEEFVLTSNAGQIIKCTGIFYLGRLFALTEKIDTLGIIHYTGCTIATNGTGCVIPGGAILTNAVVGLYGFAKENETGPILVLFEPDTGKAFVKINFEKPEGACTVNETTVEGTTVAEVLVAKKVVEAGVNEIETLKGELRFTKTNKTIWILQLGLLTIKSVKSGLSAFGVGSSLSGIAVNELDENGVPVPYGVFTA